jgi:hypothetical protein
LSRNVLGVFTAPLHSNGRGADHEENRLYIIEACLLGHVFTESLLRNGLHNPSVLLLYARTT